MNRGMTLRSVPAVLALAAALVCPAAGAQRGRLSIRFFGAAGMFSGGDINDGAQGWSDFMTMAAQSQQYSVSGEFSPARLGLEFGADIIFHLTPAWGIGLGVGCLNASSENPLTFRAGSDRRTLTFSPSYGSIPVRLGIFYAIPVSARMDMVLSAGPELHFGRGALDLDFDQNGDLASESNSANGIGIGVQGSLAFEFALSRSVGLWLEIAGRYARFGGLSGTFSSSGPDGDYEESGDMYAVEIGTMSGSRYLTVFVSAIPPTTEDYMSVRKAELDLSGGSFRIGIVIHL